MKKKTYKVLRDTQEKVGYWSFACEDQCLGTKSEGLETGDYTIEGLENIFTIERKKSTGEFAGNITETRFERELKRMDSMKHSFLILEFTLQDVCNFPMGSGIPSKFWGDLQVTSNFMLKRLIEIETNHKVKVIFAGNNAEQIAKTIFKRMAELYL